MIIERLERKKKKNQFPRDYDDVATRVTRPDGTEEKYIEGCAVLQMDHHKQILCILYNCYVESDT